VKHKVKKGYYVALQEAFLIWNPFKIRELEDTMGEGGMTCEEKEAQMYYFSCLFCDCIDRVPSRKILHWQVHVVYALLGNMIDITTMKP
jgi:hypothetical protein